MNGSKAKALCFSEKIGYGFSNRANFWHMCNRHCADFENLANGECNDGWMLYSTKETWHFDYAREYDVSVKCVEYLVSKSDNM